MKTQWIKWEHGFSIDRRTCQDIPKGVWKGRVERDRDVFGNHLVSIHKRGVPSYLLPMRFKVPPMTEMEIVYPGARFKLEMGPNKPLSLRFEKP